MEFNTSIELHRTLVDSAQRLSNNVSNLSFSSPVTHVYNPLEYAWENHCAYLEKYGVDAKKIVFVGMNPGPFGMVQTGIPFGELAIVRDWLKLVCPIQAPRLQNPARPVEGWQCGRSEVSGRRLWGLFMSRFITPDIFFCDHWVVNYCPLAFFNQGKNLTPDKLPALEQQTLLVACDQHLRDTALITQAEWVIGVGAWAEQRAKIALAGLPVRIGRILHPSPASPAANRGWAEAATKQLLELGVWQ
jgi:single-strand selective monofunctional uracil DNA glycosylase